MKAVIVGQGGREHALAWRLNREGHQIIGAPGNPGIGELGPCLPVRLSDLAGLATACAAERPDVVIVGPEAPLAGGLCDRLREAGVTTFGPSQRATRIESSKVFTKELLQAGQIPTARFHKASSEQELEVALAELGGSVAVKADGLAAGKGVIVCSSVAEARAAGVRLLKSGPVVVEEKLEGPELSVIAITDGTNVAILPPSRDHKRLLDGDQGPNTGGMGAIAPVPIPTSLIEQIRDTIIRPTLSALAFADAKFTGALFAGLMLTKDGPKVLEFNARFGDPETQAIVMALDEDIDLGLTLWRAARGEVSDTILQASGSACCIVMASSGYPDSPRTGDPIQGIRSVSDHGAEVFHAGTDREGASVMTAGGRVLSVTAKAPTLGEARAKALHAVRHVHFADAQFRTDIGATSEQG